MVDARAADRDAQGQRDGSYRSRVVHELVRDAQLGLGLAEEAVALRGGSRRAAHAGERTRQELLVALPAHSTAEVIRIDLQLLLLAARAADHTNVHALE